LLFVTKFVKSPNAANDAELNPTSEFAICATSACDADKTVPITLFPGIVPFIKEPPLPITICPLVNPLNKI